MGDGSGGLDIHAGIFQKIMAGALRHAKRAASMSAGPLDALRASKLQKNISKESKGSTKKSQSKMGGGGRWWRAALRFLSWDRRREDDDRAPTNANEDDRENPDKHEYKKNKHKVAPVPGTLYFVSSAEPHGTVRCCRPRKRRASAGRRLRPDGVVVGTGIRKMMMLTRPAPPPPSYMCLADLNAVEEGGRNGLIALIARPPPPPPIYWVT